MDYLLWFDGSKEPVSEKVQKVLDFYKEKFGVPANIVEMSLKDEPIPEGMQMVVRIQSVNIPKSHFLLGNE